MRNLLIKCIFWRIKDNPIYLSKEQFYLFMVKTYFLDFQLIKCWKNKSKIINLKLKHFPWAGFPTEHYNFCAFIIFVEAQKRENGCFVIIILNNLYYKLGFPINATKWRKNLQVVPQLLCFVRHPVVHMIRLIFPNLMFCGTPCSSHDSTYFPKSHVLWDTL